MWSYSQRAGGLVPRRLPPACARNPLRCVVVGHAAAAAVQLCAMGLALGLVAGGGGIAALARTNWFLASAAMLALDVFIIQPARLLAGAYAGTVAKLIARSFVGQVLSAFLRKIGVIELCDTLFAGGAACP